MTTAPTRKTTAARVGQVLSILVALFMLLDAVSHILKPQPVVDSLQQLGFPVSTAVTIGVLGLICTVLYVVPRTSVLGAILLTAYLGGAFSAQLRIDAPLFSALLFPVYTAIVVWAGIYLRNAELRKVLGVDVLGGRSQI